MGGTSKSDLWYWLFAIFPCVGLVLVIDRSSTLTIGFQVLVLAMIDFGIRQEKSWQKVLVVYLLIATAAVCIFRFWSSRWIYPLCLVTHTDSHAERLAGQNFTPFVGFYWQAALAIPTALLFAACLSRSSLIQRLCYVLCFMLFAYPMFTYWAWGGVYDNDGWTSYPPMLSGRALPFRHFAGESAAYALAGWSAFSVALLNRSEQRSQRRRSVHRWNHLIGVLGLWIFHAGIPFQRPIHSVDAATHLAALSGATASVLVGRVIFRTWQIKHLTIGAIAGVAGVIAPAGTLGLPSWMSMTIGASVGLLAILFSLLLEKFSVYDETGLISGLTVGGTAGTILGGFLLVAEIDQQLLGGAMCIGISLLTFLLAGYATNVVESKFRLSGNTT